MTHIISDPSMKRSGYIYDANGVGTHISAQPRIVWKHIDGPLLYCSNGLLHWLTWRERMRLWLGLADIHDIDFERRISSLAPPSRSTPEVKPRSRPFMPAASAELSIAAMDALFSRMLR